ncbi:MAG: glutamate racemase [Cyanobacteriota bacterium]|nr:glutamate racemase [Cyanobacteriota bacterium]
MTSQPIGLFDSGVGGLSVWREIVRQLPTESILYVADSAHVPYGNRSGEEVLAFCEGLCRFLLDNGCKAIVVACNTASAVALQVLRDRYPEVPILGLEPAVKPAISLSKTKVVGVMATPATFQGRLFRATVGRYARNVQLVEQVCLGLADCVESGATEEDLEHLLRGFLEPMLAAHADTIVLGCTHYPFVIESIRRLAGPERRVIDPAPAVAAHLVRVLNEQHLVASPDAKAEHHFFTTGAAARFDAACQRLLGIEAACAEVRWETDLRAGQRVSRQPADATGQQPTPRSF